MDSDARLLLLCQMTATIAAAAYDGGISPDDIDYAYTRAEAILAFVTAATRNPFEHQ